MGISMTTGELRQAGSVPEASPADPHAERELEDAAEQRRSRGADRSSPSTLSTEPPFRFEGILPRVQHVTLSFTAYVGNGVPDAMGAAGPRQFLMVINNRIKTFDKLTGQADGVLDQSPATFFRSVGSSAIDPNVRYDRRAGKWIVGAITHPSDTNGPSRLLFAVSSTGVLSTTTRWTFFQFEFDQAEPAGNTGCKADFPAWGEDAIALYIIAGAVRCPGGAAITKTLFVVSKPALYGDGPLVVSTFRNVDFAIGAPVDDPESGGGTGYFVSSRNLCRLVDAGGSPRLLPCVSLEGTQLSNFWTSAIRHRDNNAESGSTTNNVNGENTAGRLFLAISTTRTAMLRRGHIWFGISLGVDNTGQYYFANELTRDSRLGVAWLDVVDIDSDRPRVAQSGRVFHPTADNDVRQRNYWMPSLAVSGQGHMMIGASAAGSNEYVNAAAVGRLAGDASGMFRDPTLYTNAFAAYNANDSLLTGTASAPGIRRWGDYSHTSVDPCDDMTMWTIQQYTAEADKWGMAVARMSAPPPVTPTAATPAVVSAGEDSIDVQLTGAASDGAGFFDPGPEFECRLRVDIPGATVNSVRVVNPTTLSINLSTRGVSPGPLSVTITNPDGQSRVGRDVVRVQ